jgi:hypothetical protein
LQHEAIRLSQGRKRKARNNRKGCDPRQQNTRSS